MAAVYSLNRAARLLDADRNLVTFLVQDRQIPTQFVGKAKAIDEAGLDQLRREILAYQAKHKTRPAGVA